MPDRFRYEELTWPEIREAAARGLVAVLPVGALEQHGPHLPLATDVLSASELGRLAVKRVPDEAILLPPVCYSFSENQMDFPGTLTVEGGTLVQYVTEICTSLARHGFRKILLVNANPGNAPYLEAAARNVTNRTESLCALISWWGLIPGRLVRSLRASPSGGLEHAGEVETSIMLYLRGDLVRLSNAAPDATFEVSSFFNPDPLSDAPAILHDVPSRFSVTGAMGNPTTASAEKGKQFVEAAAGNLSALIREFRRRQIRPRVDHH